MARKKNSTEVTEPKPDDVGADSIPSTDVTGDDTTAPGADDVIEVDASGGATLPEPKVPEAETVEEDAPTGDADVSPDVGTVSDAPTADAEGGRTKDTEALENHGTAAGATKETPDRYPFKASMAPVARTMPQVIEKRGPGFLPLVLGGLLAGAIGFAAATFVAPPTAPAAVDMSRVDDLEARLAAMDATSDDTVDVSNLAAAQAELSTRIDALEQALPPATPADGTAEASTEVAADTEATDALRADLAALQAQVDGLPVPDAGLTDRLAAFETRLATLEQETIVVENTAEDLAREAARNQLVLAMDSGLPFDEPLDVLGGDVPEALTAMAGTGVATPSELATEFAPLAREALAEARRVEPVDGNPVTAFLRRQTGARSLEPREGTDADAVLSRMEAAVRAGDVEAALNEAALLPDEARTVLADWLARAEARVAARSALQEYPETE
ncbi:MAG: hypothetical protein WBA67_13825 [Jannaschia sp.]